jgi:hypothetical protein
MTRTRVSSPITRHRATKAEMADRREALYGIVAEQQPMTVRQVFYQATVRGVIQKTEAGYAKVQTLLADMRRVGAYGIRPTPTLRFGLRRMRPT